VFIAFHVYWALGGDFAYGDAESVTPSTTSSISGWLFTVVVLGMFAAGLLVPLAILRSWGRVVPRRLLLALLWAGFAVLAARGGAGVLDTVLRETGLVTNGVSGLSYEEAIGAASPSAYTRWSMASLEVVFALGAAFFGWAAIRAQLSRRGLFASRTA
jgi:hypothetical protein